VTTSSRKAQLGRRVLARAAGLEPQAAARIKCVAARMLQGEDVSAAELAEAFPRGAASVGGKMTGLRVEMDWNTGELFLAEAYRKVGRLGVMEINGPIFFSCGFWEVFILGCNPTSFVVEAFDQATADGTIDRLLVSMDCPGGSVAGAYELAAAIDRFKATKKADGTSREVIFLAREEICSMGMWMAAAADHIYTTPTAILGSIGTIIPIYDDSKFFEDLGIVPKFIATAERKGVGHAGVPITEENTADLRRLVDTHFADFAARVDKGRGKPSGWSASLGAQVFIGRDAVKNGLADELTEDVNALIAELANGAALNKRPAGGRVEEPAEAPPAEQPPEEIPMADIKTATMTDLEKDNPGLLGQVRERVLAESKPKPASIQELETAFPGEDKFVLDSAKKGLTLADAKGAFADVLAERVKSANAETVKAQARVAELEKLNGAGRGGAAVGAKPEEKGDLGQVPGRDASDEDRKAFAKQEWEADAGGCRSSGKFASEKAYVADRAYSLKTGR
jgi:ClpP class serine protease